jgi:hypothetical protein
MAKNAFWSQWLNGSLQVASSEYIGDIYYVDGTNGSASGSGTSWRTALSTIDAAINKCTANKGDVIFVAPWHTESVANATTIVMDTAGVSLIGICQGNQRPTITLGTATAATIPVSAGNCRISGIKIISDLADVAAGITASNAADGLQVDNCILTDGAAAKELVIGVSLAAACDGCRIINNQFYTTDGGDCASAIKMVGESARTVISGNYIFGDYSAACIDGSTAAQTIVTITNNDLRNADAAVGATISLHATSTGIVTLNRSQGGKDIVSCITAAAAMTVENYSSGEVSKSGIIDPAVDAD